MNKLKTFINHPNTRIIATFAVITGASLTAAYFVTPLIVRPPSAERMAEIEQFTNLLKEITGE